MKTTNIPNSSQEASEVTALASQIARAKALVPSFGKNILISVVLAGALLTGCGSDGCDTTTATTAESNSSTSQADNATDTAESNSSTSQTDNATDATEQTDSGSDTNATTSIKVTGNVVDGPIYGGAVKIYGLDDSLLGSATTDTAGGYSTTILNLPQKYKVKVSGGTDSGADGVQNSNDKALGFGMSAIVDRGTESNSTAHVTPATTMVSNIVEDGVIPLDDAQSLVRDGLGLGDEQYPLCRLDPNKHDRANKAGNLIALLSDIIPSSDKKSILEVIAQSLAEKEIKIKITNTSTDIESLDLAALAQKIAYESPDSISLLEIDKLSKCEALLKQSIESSITATRVTHLITTQEQEDALAQRSALALLLEKMEQSDLESMNAEELGILYANIVEGMKIILADGKLDASDPDNVALIGDMIVANLDREPSDMSTELLKLSYKYQETLKIIQGNTEIKYKKSIKKVIRAIYSQSSIDKLDEVIAALSSESTISQLALATNTIEDKVSGESDEMSEELRRVLQEIVGGQISNEIETLAGATLTSKHITARLSETLDNDTLLTQLKSTLKIKVNLKIKGKKIKLTIKEKAELTACGQVVASMKMSVKIKGFGNLSSDSIDTMLAHLTGVLEQSHNQESSEAYEEKIKALELSLVNLKNKFNTTEFDSRVTTTIRVIQKIKITDGSDLHKSIVKIKIKIKQDFLKVTLSLKTTIEELEKILENYIVPEVTQKRIIKLPQPRLETLPTTQIMIAI